MIDAEARNAQGKNYIHRANATDDLSWQTALALGAMCCAVAAAHARGYEGFLEMPLHWGWPNVFAGIEE